MCPGLIPHREAIQGSNGESTQTTEKAILCAFISQRIFQISAQKMVVSSFSSPLKRKDGSLLNGTSGEQHTLAAHDGLTQICHFNSSQWMSQNTLYQILMKGRLWLEAY